MQGMELSIWLKHIPKESPEFIPTNSNFTPKSSFLIKLFVIVMHYFLKRDLLQIRGCL